MEVRHDALHGSELFADPPAISFTPDHGPVCYRVTTLFGKVLYSQRSQRCDEGLTRAGPDDFRLGGVSIVASAKGSQVQLNTRRISSNSASSHKQVPANSALGL
jgi:hypothetical protein